MSRLTRSVALLACSSLALAGCASRLDRSTIVRAQGDGTASVTGQGGSGPGSAGQGGTGSGPGSVGSGQSGGSALTGPASGTGSAGSGGTGTGTTGAGSPGSAGTGSAGTGSAGTGSAGTGAAGGGAAGGGRGQGGTGSGSGAGGSAPGASGSGAGAQSNGKPIVIGVIGSVSGLYGPVFTPMLDGIQIHVAEINRAGGINGHPVKLVVNDDNADPANYSSLVRTDVESKNVIGFMNLHGITLSQSIISYIESKNIPVIDGDDSNQLSPTSRMIFNFGGAGTNLNGSEFSAVAAVTGAGKKIGFISCQEVQQCTDYDNSFDAFAQRAGDTPVYRGRQTLTAPDFTQNCLQAQSAGVEILFLRMDTNSVKRIARDCSRQGFRPKYALSPALTDNTFPSNPALEGMIIPSQTFPFINAGTPQEKEFQAAMRRNRPADQISAGNGQGWSVASIFARAAAMIGPADTPSTALLLTGLYTFSGQTLQGQTQPLTYRPGKPPVNAGRPCSFPMLLSRGRWTTPTGGKLTCLKG